MTQVTRQLGRYELLEKIAAGGMGEIFLARMRGAAGFERQVIIKTILPHLAEQDEFVSKFLNEAHTVVQLVHGNIVPVFDMGEQNGEYFIAMEYVPGRDLRGVIKQLLVHKKVFPVNIALHIISEVCKGLGYAHRKVDAGGKSLELVHRDVSPSNVLVSNEGEVRLIDFGIAHVADGLTRSVSGRIQGKFCYMSPEQASGKRLDARSDIFSTGVMLYEMLTGVRPFHGSNDMETLELVRAAVFEPPSTLVPTISTEVDEILERAMAKDVTQRYKDAGELLADLMQYMYMNEGGAPTSQDVVALLEELFPDGVVAKAKPKRQSLDDILAAQIDQVLPSPSSLPFEETSSASMDVSGQSLPSVEQDHTATIMTASGSHSPVLVNVPREELHDPQTSPTVEEGPPLSEDSSVSQNSTPSYQYTSDAMKAISAPLPVVIPEVEVEDSPGGLRWIALLGIPFAFLGVIVLLFSFPQKGTVLVESTPVGSQIEVDGVMRVQARTPIELELTPGVHRLRVRHPEFLPSEVREVNVKRQKLPQVLTFTLKAKPPSPQPTELPKTRPLKVESDPPGANVIMDGKVLGSAPLVVQMPMARETVVLDLKHPGCRDRNQTVSTRHAQEVLRVKLECEEKQDPVVKEPTKPPTTNNPPAAAKPTRVRVDVTPSDASVWIDGVPVKGGLSQKTYPKQATIEVRAEKSGFAPIRRRVQVAGLRRGNLKLKLQPVEQGCVNIRIMEPALGVVLIDGRSIGQVKFAKKGLQLGAGVHTIKAVNKAAGREESKKVAVSSGTASCSNVVFFEPR